MDHLTLSATLSALRKYFDGSLVNDVRIPQGRWVMIQTNDPKGRYPLENITHDEVEQAFSDLRDFHRLSASMVQLYVQREKCFPQLAKRFEVSTDKVAELVGKGLGFLSHRILEVSNYVRPES